MAGFNQKAKEQLDKILEHRNKAINYEGREETVTRDQVQIVRDEESNIIYFSEKINCAAVLGVNGQTIIVIVSKQAVIVGSIVLYTGDGPLNLKDVKNSALKGMSLTSNVYEEKMNSYFRDVDDPYAVVIAPRREQDLYFVEATRLMLEHYSRWALKRKVALTTYELTLPDEHSGLELSVDQFSSLHIDRRGVRPQIWVNGWLIDQPSLRPDRLGKFDPDNIIEHTAAPVNPPTGNPISGPPSGNTPPVGSPLNCSPSVNTEVVGSSWGGSPWSNSP